MHEQKHTLIIRFGTRTTNTTDYETTVLVDIMNAHTEKLAGDPDLLRAGSFLLDPKDVDRGSLDPCIQCFGVGACKSTWMPSD